VHYLSMLIPLVLLIGCGGKQYVSNSNAGFNSRPTDSSFDSLLREPVNRSTLSNCRGGYWTNCKAVIFRSEFAYFGEWQNDKYHGIGSIDYYNSDKFIGEFREGLYDGRGSLFDRNGRLKQSGIWRAGSLVQPMGANSLPPDKKTERSKQDLPSKPTDLKKRPDDKLEPLRVPKF